MKHLTLLLILLPELAQAAACCAAGSAVPSLITGDDKAQLSLSAAADSVIGDAFVAGLPRFRAGADDESTRTLQASGALLLSDRFQAGLSIPLTQRSRDYFGSLSGSSGIGDLNLNAGYEYLPEWEYSEWKPRGLGFVKLTLPTGGSALGKGFYTISAGSLLLKNWSRWTASLLTELHRSLPRTFDDGTGAYRITPGWGGSLGINVTHRPWEGPLQLGFGITPIYEQGSVTEGAVASTSSYRLVWNTLAQVIYVVHDEWSLSADYVDQTLLGPAKNTSLTRTFSVQSQWRWLR